MFGNGWDNAAFLVAGNTVFRFPRRREFAKLIEREAAIVPTIAADVPLRISSPTYVGAARPRFPWAFSGHPLIEGTTACSVYLTRVERMRLATPLAHFLRALHAIDAGPLIECGLTGDEIGRLDYEKRLKMARDRTTFLASNGFHGVARLGDWMAAHPPRALPDAARRVVHGDLYARHIVLSETTIAGIIDWGDVHYGDPALDLAVALLVLPPEAHDAFRTGYGGIDGSTWDVARFRAIYHAFVELEYGLRERDEGMRAAGETALAFLAE